MTGEEKQKAIDALKISAPVKAVTQEEFNNYIQTLNKIMDWLEQDSCDDAVSRQYLLDNCVVDKVTMPYVPVSKIENAPPVTPQQKTGHWIIIDDCEQFIAKCSECGQIEDSRMISKYPYCHCGARMVESQGKEEV